jgi:hypothetical protein
MAHVFEEPHESFADVGLVLGNGDANRRGSVFVHRFLERSSRGE